MTFLADFGSGFFFGLGFLTGLVAGTGALLLWMYRKIKREIEPILDAFQSTTENAGLDAKDSPARRS